MIAPRSLGWRLAASTFTAIAALALLLTLWYQRQTHDLLDQESDERLAALASYVAVGALHGTIAHSPEMLAPPLDAAMAQPDVEVVAIFDPSGRLVASRTRADRPVPRWTGATECRPCAIDGERLRWVAPVNSAWGARAAAAAGVYEGPPPAASGRDSPAGWLLLDVTTAAHRAAERRITARGLLIAAAALVLALAVTLLIAQGLTSPLRALAHATHEIGEGRWDVALPRATSTEIAQLAADFGAMTAALAALDRENARHREHLEERVAARTRELEEAYQEMKAMAEAKDQFVATVSHDFRSPLAIVLSAVQTVLADPAMPEDVRRQFLSRAERQCKRLGALVNDLLDLARIENRDAAVERVPLAEVVDEVVDGARAAFDQRAVSLQWIPPGDAVVADVDRGLIVRALSNLVDNARKFTPASGRVTVELCRRDGRACISVRDTGPGIPEDERAHLFERFFQGRRGRELGSGSGLGLAIVAGVARQHGGTVAVTSAKDAGSTFELQLPLSTD